MSHHRRWCCMALECHGDWNTRVGPWNSVVGDPVELLCGSSWCCHHVFQMVMWLRIYLPRVDTALPQRWCWFGQDTRCHSGYVYSQNLYIWMLKYCVFLYSYVQRRSHAGQEKLLKDGTVYIWIYSLAHWLVMCIGQNIRALRQHYSISRVALQYIP